MTAPTPPALDGLFGGTSPSTDAGQPVHLSVMAQRVQANAAALLTYAQGVLAEAQGLVAAEAGVRATAVAAETAARTAAIAAEAAARSAEVTAEAGTQSDAVAAEAAARFNADAGLQGQIDLKAPLASPVLTGSPTAPTPAPGTNSTRLATMAALQVALAALPAGPDLSGYALLASPVFSGTPTAPKPPSANNSTRLATTSFVFDAEAFLQGQINTLKSRIDAAGIA